jgi:hypothetical protein
VGRIRLDGSELTDRRNHQITSRLANWQNGWPFNAERAIV